MSKYNYIYMNYLVAGHSFTGKNLLFTREKRYELCQAMYDATSSGDYNAIYKFKPNGKIITCRDFGLELNQSRFPQVLAELNDKIRLWETEHNFKNSYDAEKHLSTSLMKDMIQCHHPSSFMNLETIYG